MTQDNHSSHQKSDKIPDKEDEWKKFQEETEEKLSEVHLTSNGSK